MTEKRATRRFSILILFATLVLSSAFTHAFPSPAHHSAATADSQAASAQDPPDIAAARAALEAGQYEDAVRRTSLVLLHSPNNHAAAEIKVSALLAQKQLNRALSTYDTYVAALRTPDMQVLASIARASIGQSLQDRKDDLIFRAAALERLARHGDANALAMLQSDATHHIPSGALSPETLAPLVSLARLGDQRGLTALARLLDTAPADSTFMVLQAIETANARSLASSVAVLLGDSRPIIRGLAALAVGALGYNQAIVQVRALMDDAVPIVRLDAALALKRLGDHAADAFVGSLLKSPAPEVRLMAAEACAESNGNEWVAPMTELLSDANEITRLRAAALLARYDPPKARSVLVTALDSRNGFVRTESARILEEKDLADGYVARRLLDDPLDAVRLHGAGSALRTNVRQ